jgi:hypothetical protein
VVCVVGGARGSAYLLRGCSNTRIDKKTQQNRNKCTVSSWLCCGAAPARLARKSDRVRPESEVAGRPVDSVPSPAPERRRGITMISCWVQK